MNKIVVTKENYEEVMFDLLEDQYTKEQREDILNQIAADTFLSFEWKQWTKAQYSESLEFYKRDEAPFIESLVKPEEKKGYFINFYKPMSIAASLLLLLGISVVLFNKHVKDDELVNTMVKKENIAPSIVLPSNETNNDSNVQSIRVELPNQIHGAVQKQLPKEEVQMAIQMDTIQQPVVVMENPIKKIQDTVQWMIAEAVKKDNKPKSRYKITITESKMDGSEQTKYAYNEKRYSMADIMVHKDGITLSKFLDNSTSKIIKTDEATYIEYIAADMSVLVLTLSN